MTSSYLPGLCKEVEGLLCLSDLPDLEQDTLCSAQEPCLHFFQGMGFRPAVKAVERDQYGDRTILIVSDDEAYYSKFDMPIDSLPIFPTDGSLSSAPAVPMQPLLATAGGSPSPFVFGGLPASGGFIGGVGGSVGTGPRPATPVESGTGNSSEGSVPGTNIPVEGGGTDQLPPITPIPLSGSGLFLIIALVVLFATSLRRALNRPGFAGG